MYRIARTLAHTHTHARTHKHKHTHTHARAHMHTHMHTHTHARTRAHRYDYCFIFPLDLRGKRPQWVAARREAQVATSLAKIDMPSPNPAQTADHPALLLT
jgi:hypothetical protein